jgi:hypothetical protein
LGRSTTGAVWDDGIKGRPYEVGPEQSHRSIGVPDH